MGKYELCLPPRFGYNPPVFDISKEYLFPNVKAKMEELQEQGYLIVVVTNESIDHFKVSLKKFKFTILI